MTRFRLTPLAERDLEVIVDYISERNSPNRADAVLQDILDAAERLARRPGIGHERDDLADEDVRFWAVAPGCSLLTDLVVLIPVPPAGLYPTVRLGPDTALRGLGPVYCQWLAGDSVNALGLIVSNGVRIELP